MSAPKSILVFRNGAIGNTLAAVPALKCLRLSFPEARICAVLDSVGAELLEHCPYLDVIITYDKRGADAGVAGAFRIVKALRAQRPELVILFKRFFRNGLLAWLSGADQRAGFATEGSSPFLNLTIPYQETVHVAELNLELVKACGANAPVDNLPELFVSADDVRYAEDLLRESGVTGAFVIAHFGGLTSGASHVNMEFRVELLQRLAPEHTVVIVGSGNAELAEAAELRSRVPNAVSFAGAPLRATIALMLRAHAFIGTNSGPMNLAAAAKLPGIALFRNDEKFQIESVKWRPLFPDLRILPVPVGVRDLNNELLLREAKSLFRMRAGS